MKPAIRVLWLWIGTELLYLLTLILFPYRDLQFVGFLSYSIQTLLFFVCLEIFKKEPTKKNKIIFLNFAVFFSLAFLAHAMNFLGTVVPSEWVFADPNGAGDPGYARMVFHQYVFGGAYFLFLAIAVIYISLDVVFRQWRTSAKYISALLIAGSFFVFYYQPFLADPLFLHHTDELGDWRALDDASALLAEKGVQSIDPETLSQAVVFYDANGSPLSSAANLQRVKDLLPYLEDPNWEILVFRPLNQNIIFMSVLTVGFILLFFGYQIAKDPPQGAYIEKIMFMFLVFSTLEILHAWASMNSLGWEHFNTVIVAGQYFSTVALCLIAFFFYLRLGFITSINGEFYEQEIAASPKGVTRWRDDLDNLLIEKFFNRKLLLGRMLVDPTRNK